MVPCGWVTLFLWQWHLIRPFVNDLVLQKFSYYEEVLAIFVALDAADRLEPSPVELQQHCVLAGVAQHLFYLIDVFIDECALQGQVKQVACVAINLL